MGVDSTALNFEISPFSQGWPVGWLVATPVHPNKNADILFKYLQQKYILKQFGNVEHKTVHILKLHKHVHTRVERKSEGKPEYI